MGVVKKTGFAAPYRSLTFRGFVGAIVSRSGVMSILADVFESAGIVYIPPMTFNQQGLIVTTDIIKQVVKPPTLIAPYFLIVTAPTSNQVDDLSWTFAQTPGDVGPASVIVAEWDGNEWRQPPLVSIDELIKGTEQDRLDYGWAAPVKGLLTSVSGPNYDNSSGVVIDKDGRKTRLDNDLVVAQIADDPNGAWKRVDRMVYRRIQDSVDRIGRRELLRGGTYTSGSQIVAGPSIKSAADQHRKVKAAVDNGNIGFVMTAEGFGNSFTLWLSRVTAARTGTDMGATLITGLNVTDSEFDFAIDPATGDCHVVYVDNGDLRFVHTDRDANVIDGPALLDSPSQPCVHPRILMDATGKFIVTYQVLLGPTNSQIYLTTCDDTGATITLPRRVTNTANNLINQSMAITTDLILYLAYQDQSTGKIYYDTLDDIGTVTTLAPIYISASVNSTSYGANSDNASLPCAMLSDNRELVITFLQLRGGFTGLVVWKDGSGYSPDLTSSGEDIGTYDAAISDFMNDVWVYASYASSTERTILDTTLSGQDMVIISDSVGAKAQSVSLIQDITGSLFLTQSAIDPGTYTNVDAAQPIDVIGPATLVGSFGTVNLAANQISMVVASLTHAPAQGEALTVAGAAHLANNGTKIITAVAFADFDGAADTYVVTLDSNFSAAESPALGVDGQFADPDGMAVVANKLAAETATRALRTDALPSDVLLSRILRPGPVILNYVLIPAFGGNVEGIDRYGVYGNAQMDWGTTTPNDVTINSAIGILDLLLSLDYAVSAGTYPMVEGDCLYVVLDGVNLSVVPIVANVASLPWSQPIQVLGFIRDGDFNPVLLAQGGGKELTPGETIVIGLDLPLALRTRIGFTSDTTFEAYTSDIAVGVNDTYPAALSNLDIAAGQNKNIKLVRGGKWSLAGSILAWSADAFLQVTALAEARNRIPAGNATLTNDGDVAYVNVNRAGSTPATLTVGVAAIGALIPGRNTIVIARKIGAAVVLSDTVQLVNGESKSLEQGISDQNQTAIGITGEAQSSPAWNATLSAPLRTIPLNTTPSFSAIASMDIEIDKFFGQMLLTPHPTLTQRVIIRASDVLMQDGATRSQVISSLLVFFQGAQLSFGGGDAGTIYAQDGTTPVATFTVPVITAGKWRWFSISASAGAATVDNRINITLAVVFGTADGTTQDNAVRGTFPSGTPIGAVAVHALGGGVVSAITAANIVQPMVGGGGGGSGGSSSPPVVVQEEAIYTGTPGVYTISQTPMSDESLWVWRNRTVMQRLVAWNLVGTTITFSAGFEPDPFTQPVYVSYIVAGVSSLAAMQEMASAVSGNPALYNLVGQPSNAASTWVTVDGLIVDGSLWSLNQTLGIFAIQFTAGNEPGVGQEVYVLYFTPAGVLVSGGVMGAVNLGTGTGVWSGLITGILEFKSLKPGSNIAISSTSTEITISASGVARFDLNSTTPGAPQVVDPAVGIVTNNADRMLIYVVSQGGQQDITALPGIFSGSFAGQELKLVGTSDTNYPTLHDKSASPGSLLRLQGSMDLQLGSTILLTWDGTYWNEDTRR